MSVDTRVRTSLGRAPSSFTDPELADHQAEYEVELFRKHRVLVIARDDPELKGLDRILWDRIAVERFGKWSEAA